MLSILLISVYSFSSLSPPLIDVYEWIAVEWWYGWVMFMFMIVVFLPTPIASSTTAHCSVYSLVIYGFAVISFLTLNVLIWFHWVCEWIGWVEFDELNTIMIYLLNADAVARWFGGWQSVPMLGFVFSFPSPISKLIVVVSVFPSIFCVV